MSGFFAPHDSHQEPWFRIGRLEVTTVVLVILVALLAGLAWVAAPSLPGQLAYSPELAASGQVWRVVTWPFAIDLSLWTVITLALFWYFGTDLERLIGRTRMAWLLLGMWASLTAAYTIVALIAGGAGLGGLDFIQFLLLLLWVAEYPSRPFFFSIPAWVVGAILVAVRIFGLLAARDMSGLLSLLFSFVLVAIVARAVGLLGEYAWIPGRVAPGRPVTARGPRTTRTSTRQANRHASDRDRLDDLLDQINANGIGSLSEAQRRELLKLRERLRRQ
ncbi:MAG: hypothetical protein ACOH1Y_07330 [Propionicimonas sp.]